MMNNEIKVKCTCTKNYDIEIALYCTFVNMCSLHILLILANNDNSISK